MCERGANFPFADRGWADDTASIVPNRPQRPRCGHSPDGASSYPNRRPRLLQSAGWRLYVQV